MKVTKHYEQDHIMLYMEDHGMRTCITLESDRQMRMLGECLIDLERTGGRQVEIGESR